jgi:hypothetical protein
MFLHRSVLNIFQEDTKIVVDLFRRKDYNTLTISIWFGYGHFFANYRYAQVQLFCFVNSPRKEHLSSEYEGTSTI